jgi:hypothetical protein
VRVKRVLRLLGMVKGCSQLGTGTASSEGSGSSGTTGAGLADAGVGIVGARLPASRLPASGKAGAGVAGAGVADAGTPGAGFARGATRGTVGVARGIRLSLEISGVSLRRWSAEGADSPDLTLPDPGKGRAVNRMNRVPFGRGLRPYAGVL